MGEEYYNKDGSISLIDKDVDKAIKMLENKDEELNKNSNLLNFIGGMLLGGFCVMVIWVVFYALSVRSSINNDPAEELNYKHYTMEQNGYNYCPYCGKDIKEKE